MKPAFILRGVILLALSNRSIKQESKVGQPEPEPLSDSCGEALWIRADGKAVDNLAPDSTSNALRRDSENEDSQVIC